jgi:Flp pilus assembly protein TadG
MQIKGRHPSRRGAALVEAAVVVPVFLTFVLGMIDLANGVFLQHGISYAARQAARQASVHGSLTSASPYSSWNGGAWGPSTYGPVTANTNDPKAQAVANNLGGLDTSQVYVTYQWPDGANVAESDNRVQVTVTTNWTPVITSIFGANPIALTATSTMPIAH